jgi:hypothetical protein
MIEIKPNLAEAVAFAVSLPTDQAHLCAIHPAGNRPVVGRSFPKTEAGQAAALRWLIEADRKGYGIYFNANEVESLGKGHAKAKEAEVSTVRFLHVDADLPAGTAPDDVETARAELLAKIKAAPLVPSLIVNSGNGFGVFWELADPITVTDENRDDIKARNVALADQLGGDDCENLDRVMRLPFTVNRPNAKKIKADGGYLDMTAAEVLHDHVARQHGSDLIIGGQRLVRQRRITRAQYPIISEINVELFLHGRFDIDFGQKAKSLGFERLPIVPRQPTRRPTRARVAAVA